MKFVANSIDNSQLFYKENTEVDNSISKITDNLFPKKKKHVQNEAPALKITSKTQGENVSINNSDISLLQNTINIQLPYDVNQATEQDA